MDDEMFTPSAPLSWQGIGAIALAGVSGMLEEAAGILEGFATALAADHNWQLERREMHEQAALEIEALTRGIEP